MQLTKKQILRKAKRKFEKVTYKKEPNAIHSEKIYNSLTELCDKLNLKYNYTSKQIADNNTKNKTNFRYIKPIKGTSNFIMNYLPHTIINGKIERV